MLSTFAFMAMLPFYHVPDALVVAAVVTAVVSVVPGSTAFVQSVEAAALGS